MHVDPPRRDDRWGMAHGKVPARRYYSATTIREVLTRKRRSLDPGGLALGRLADSWPARPGKRPGVPCLKAGRGRRFRPPGPTRSHRARARKEDDGSETA